MTKFIVVSLLALLMAGCVASHNPKEVKANSVDDKNSAKVDAQYDAELAYKEGRYSHALKLYRQLAEQGNMEAQNDLAFMYLRGHGVPKDATEGANLILMAAERGHKQSQNDLGMLYFYDEGVTKNNVLSYMWLVLSAEDGYIPKSKRFTKAAALPYLLSREDFEDAYHLINKCRANRFKGCKEMYFSSLKVKET